MNAHKNNKISGNEKINRYKNLYVLYMQNSILWTMEWHFLTEDFYNTCKSTFARLYNYRAHISYNQYLAHSTIFQLSSKTIGYISKY